MLTEPFVAFTPDPTPAAVQRLAAEALAQGARGLIVWAADANGLAPADVDAWLAQLPVPVAGGVFPQLIHGGENHERGYVVVGWPSTFEVVHVDGLSRDDTDAAAALAQALPAPDGVAAVMVWVDGLAPRIAAALDAVYDQFGSDVTYFGGGAGSLSFQPRPCLFSREGLRADALQLVLLRERLALGVDHGWQPLAGPFVVTGGHGPVIESLDHRPAYEVYRDAVRSDAGRDPAPEGFFDVAKGYPFGLDTPDGRLVVRDPITIEGSGLRCVGDVPPYSLVHLLRGDPQALVQAAARGAQALAATRGPVLVADCISRVLYLEQRFGEELAAIRAVIGDRALAGVLTLGEVANGGDTCLEFYNKTIVLAALAADADA